MVVSQCCIHLHIRVKGQYYLIILFLFLSKHPQPSRWKDLSGNFMACESSWEHLKWPALSTCASHTLLSAHTDCHRPVCVYVHPQSCRPLLALEPFFSEGPSLLLDLFPSLPPAIEFCIVGCKHSLGAPIISSCPCFTHKHNKTSGCNPQP